MGSYWSELAPASPAINILAVFGIYALLFFVYNKMAPFLRWVYAYCCRSPKDLRAYGEWAVVTGATDGIGKRNCIEFAERGINVVLISRSKAKCEAVEEELKKQYPKVQFTHIAIDFGNFDAQARERVQSKVEGLDVGLLINNVGYGGAFPKYFFENPDEEMTGQVEININSTLWMTKIILGDDKQGMVFRKRGAIVNIGSGAGYAPTGLTSCYGAAKAYIIMFTRSLNAEMAQYNIHVSVQTPGRVWTNMTGGMVDKPTLLFPNAETYVKSAIRFIGYEAATAGYWPHEYTKWAENLVTDSFWNRKWMEAHMAIREQVFSDYKAGKYDTPTAAEPSVLEMPQILSLKGTQRNPGMD